MARAMKTKNKKRLSVYVGPGVPESGLSCGRVFKGDLPAEVTVLLENNPWLSGLFVSPDGVAAARLALKTKGTVLRRLAERVVAMRGGSRS